MYFTIFCTAKLSKVSVNVAEEKAIIIVGGWSKNGNKSEAILFDETCALPNLPVNLCSPAVLMTEGSNEQEIVSGQNLKMS